ncbi:MAG: ATP-binding protein [Candidatus Aminicenantes bacterium]|nr:ATP-binding protein [Candidatus Aminicenantes bacterium]
MKKGLHIFYLILGCLIIFIGYYGYRQHLQRPGISPVTFLKTVTFDDGTSTIMEGIIVKIDGTALTIDGKNVKQKQKKEIEFLLSKKSIGDTVIVLIRFNGEPELFTPVLQPFYNTPVPLINFLIGLFCAATGYLVFVLRPQSKKARVYYWATLAFYLALCITDGVYVVGNKWHSYIPGILFYFSYSFVVALYLHFSFQYTQVSSGNIERWKLPRSTIFAMLYGPAIIFSALLGTLFLLSFLQNSIDIYRLFLKVHYIFRFYVIFYLSYAVVHFTRLFRLSFIEEQRARIKWAVFGMVLSLTPFILLYQLPDLLGLNPFINQDWSNVFLLFIPLTLAISILKYNLLNIDLVIKKSLIYASLTVFTVSIYLLSAELFKKLIDRLFEVNNIINSGLAALVAASTFHPARKKIQELVDKSFFRVSYDYKKSILSFIERAQKMINSEKLIDFFLMKIEKTLPIESLGVIIYDRKLDGETILFQRNKIDELDYFLDLEQEQDFIFARKSSVQTEERVDFSQESFLEKNKIEAVIPLFFHMTNINGFLSLGRKKSEERYSSEDIELLQTMSQEFSLNLERIRLQEAIFIEKAEKVKLAELNLMKTEFVSAVSHEIRTPMSSILGLSELLKGGKIKESAKQEELLNLITSECTRLSRFLHNILEFGKIERDAKQYNFEQTEIQALIKDTLKLFEPRLNSEGFKLKTHFSNNPVFLDIDRDAVKQALTNLVDNAIKYSQEKREIEIFVFDGDSQVEIQVKDKGAGIPEKEEQKIFQDFYRSPEAVRQCPSGVGLGLKIVKHIMEAHNGKVQVSSHHGDGSSFFLIFLKP